MIITIWILGIFAMFWALRSVEWLDHTETPWYIQVVMAVSWPFTLIGIVLAKFVDKIEESV